ncbi:MAG: UDP-N-acetylmuramoyl-L-alanyl-D-glutamate--2,6-diaminopimelate ligase, partial [Magnetococcales bacterium]|nr:UDP-N-acetylmuramoyl-L-alanyl-D-glutamate--2,6-diaminopimelate ligase [Magnetococcales bacterium]
MKLSELLAQTRLEGWNPPGTGITQEVTITGLTADSRQVIPGALFAALPGSRDDGTRFIEPAIASGAVAILHPADLSPPPGVISLPHPEPRRALAALAAAYWGHPADHLKMIGITGSNGKTTVAAMVEAILTRQGIATGVIGTTGTRHPGGTRPAALTTPDPITLHQSLAAMREAGCSAAVAEVSSHALTQCRTAGIFWQAAAFTNLSRDHLDYH